jgi:Tol biopolymer transport system component
MAFRVFASAIAAACVVTAATSAAPTAPRRPMIVSRHAVWFPDSRTIAFESNLERPRTAYLPGEALPYDDPGLDVFSVALDGSGLRNLTRDSPDVADIYPSVSPDGSRIAFLRRTASGLDLLAMAADGAAKQLIARDVTAWRPTWSPDGREIAFAACCESGRSFLYLADVEAGSRRSLAPSGSTTAWSPDGSRLAYVAPLVGNLAVFVADRSGGSPRPVAGGVADHTISWSPDSTRIAFDASGPRRFERGVGVASANGGPSRFLVRGAGPAWSPDGGRIAFTTGDIETIDVDSGAIRFLVGGRLSQLAPRWSPDGAHLLFVSGAGLGAWPEVGSYLEVVRADGTDRRRITPDSPPAVQTVVAAATVSRPDRLTIPSVVDTPDAVRPGGVVTARVTVETALAGNLVDGADVSVSASRGTAIAAVPRVARTVGGHATMRIRLVRVPRRARVVRLFFVASRPGDTTVSAYPYDVVVTLRRRR